jgi:chemotaxis protein MotB
MNNIQKTLFLLITAIIFMSGCVSERKYAELKAQHEDCMFRKDRFETGLKEAEIKLKSEREIIDYLRKEVAGLRLDSSECFTSLNRTKQLYEDLQRLQEKILSSTKDEQERTRRELMETSDLLRNREKEMKVKEELLRENERKIRSLQENLFVREARVNELEKILSSKDSSVNALKESMQKALFSFQNSGLTVEVKNGKVYVSLEEKLLFKSGSIDVDANGRNALLELAKALRNENDVSVMVEGHTDNVPMRTASIKDNWDLSVLRATSIVRILTVEGKLNPTRVMAAGRGEFVPVDSADTRDARAKNRRTEIILTPKLDKLLEILGN